MNHPYYFDFCSCFFRGYFFRRHNFRRHKIAIAVAVGIFFAVGISANSWCDQGLPIQDTSVQEISTQGKGISECDELFTLAVRAEQANDLNTAELRYQQCCVAAQKYRLGLKEALALHRIAVIKALNKKFTESRIFFERAMTLDPQNTEILADYAQLYADRKDFEQAETILKEALEKRPHDSTLLFKLGQSIASQQSARKDEGLRYMTLAVGEVMAHQELAQIYRSQGNVGQAELEEKKAKEAELRSNQMPPQHLNQTSPYTANLSQTNPLPTVSSPLMSLEKKGILPKKEISKESSVADSADISPVEVVNTRTTLPIDPFASAIVPEQSAVRRQGFSSSENFKNENIVGKTLNGNGIDKSNMEGGGVRRLPIQTEMSIQDMPIQKSSSVVNPFDNNPFVHADIPNMSVSITPITAESNTTSTIEESEAPAIRRISPTDIPSSIENGQANIRKIDTENTLAADKTVVERSENPLQSIHSNHSMPVSSSARIVKMPRIDQPKNQEPPKSIRPTDALSLANMEHRIADDGAAQCVRGRILLPQKEEPVSDARAKTSQSETFSATFAQSPPITSPLSGSPLPKLSDKNTISAQKSATESPHQSSKMELVQNQSSNNFMGKHTPEMMSFAPIRTSSSSLPQPSETLSALGSDVRRLRRESAQDVASHQGTSTHAVMLPKTVASPFAFADSSFPRETDPKTERGLVSNTDSTLADSAIPPNPFLTDTTSAYPRAAESQPTFTPAIQPQSPPTALPRVIASNPAPVDPFAIKPTPAAAESQPTFTPAIQPQSPPTALPRVIASNPAPVDPFAVKPTPAVVESKSAFRPANEPSAIAASPATRRKPYPSASQVPAYVPINPPLVADARPQMLTPPPVHEAPAGFARSRRHRQNNVYPANETVNESTEVQDAPGFARSRRAKRY